MTKDNTPAKLTLQAMVTQYLDEQTEFLEGQHGTLLPGQQVNLRDASVLLYDFCRAVYNIDAFRGQTIEITYDEEDAALQTMQFGDLHSEIRQQA